jgi:hypothetical protein
MTKRVFVLVSAMLMVSCDRGPAPPDVAYDQGEMDRRLAQFAPAEIDFDDSMLLPWEKDVLKRLVTASDTLHQVFLEQVSPSSAQWRQALTTRDSAAAAYFDLMTGPWDRLDHDKAFLDVPAKPIGAGFYPPEMTKEQFDAWLTSHPQDRESFTSYFTVIRKQDDSLFAVPYSQAYAARVTAIAKLLEEASSLAENASLKDYLVKRAESFRRDDYYASDLAWMDLDSRIEPTIGPYEVYEDGLFGYKAAFESFITLSDSAASEELSSLKNHLSALERALPIEERFKNPNRSFESPIRVVDVIYTAGDARSGVATTAFNLPNDVRVHEQKGSKKVMLRNVARAKFDKILKPIAAEVFAPELAAEIEFQPWFTNVVMHELSHGLGPTTVTTPSGERTSVSKALRELHSTLEEAKADVTGLHSLSVLAQNGEYDATFVRKAQIGHFADLFRAVRFGANEAHGQANLIQFNWLREKGAIRFDSATGKYSADLEAMTRENRELARTILTIQARGSHDEATALIEKYGKVSPEMSSVIARLAKVPVDIRPQYTVTAKMKAWN